MNKFIIRWLINSLAVFAAVWLLDIAVEGNEWVTYLVLGLVLTLVNTFVRPLAKVVGCLPNLLTLGLFTLVINAFLFWLTGVIGTALGFGYSVEGFWPAFWGGLIVGVVSAVMGFFFRDELKGRK